MKLVTILVMLTLTIAACGDGGNGPASAPEPTSTLIPLPATHVPTPTPEPTATPIPTSPPVSTATPEPVIDRAVLLEEFAQVFGNAIAKQEWALAHALYPDEFKRKCPQLEFATLMTFVWDFAGYPEDLEYRVDDLQIDGDDGWVDSSYLKDGLIIDILPSDDEEDHGPWAVWVDGEWSIYMSPDDLAADEPCSLETSEETLESSATSEPVPVLGTATEADGSIYTVNIMRDPAPVGYSGFEEGMRIVAFDITQQAMKDGEHSNPFYFRIQDDQDYTYPKSGSVDLEPRFSSGTLDEGQKRRGWVAFEIPTTSTVVSVWAEGQVFGPATLIADLIQFDALDLYDDNQNGRITCDEAENHRIVPVGQHHPAYKHMTDPDEDGLVCE